MKILSFLVIILSGQFKSVSCGQYHQFLHFLSALVKYYFILNLITLIIYYFCLSDKIKVLI